MMRFTLITADVERARQAEAAGVSRIMIDLEQDGKRERQKSRDTWISDHTIEQVAPMRAELEQAELMVRINPYGSNTETEIDAVLTAGAQVIMLPMFLTLQAVSETVEIIAGRAKLVPLVETGEALSIIETVAKHAGVSETFIGLNDLHLSLGLTFMFEPLADGTLENVAHGLRQIGKPFGFGGIARVGEGQLPAELILREHARLGSKRVILSRAFSRRSQSFEGMTFRKEISKLHNIYHMAQDCSSQVLEKNRRDVVRRVKQIIAQNSN